MAIRTYAEEYRTIIVCVDSYEHEVPKGRFYNPFLSEGRSFQSLTEFILEMEQTLDSMDYPKAYTTTRTFATPPAKSIGPPDTSYEEGELATFALRILFRQNASWQGSIIWLDQKQEQSFRSVLELILLFDNALTQNQAS